MIKKITAVFVLCSCMAEVNAHDFTDSYGGTVLDSFDLSASDIWYGYFLPENVLLAQQLAHNQQRFIYINHPHLSSDRSAGTQDGVYYGSRWTRQRPTGSMSRRVSACTS